MKTHRLTLLTAAVLALGLPAWAQTGSPATPAAATAPAAKPATAPAAKAPADWIVWDDTTYTPVLDEVSQSLADARKAVAAKDNARAAEAMTAAARALEKQAAQAARMEQQRAVADEKLARETRQRMDKLVKQLDATAAQLKAGKLATPAALDKALTQAQRADLERRWLVTDVTTWYPVVEQPQTHFLAAAEAYAKKDYKAAATEVRKAAGFVRLEAARAVGDSRRALDESAAALSATAKSLDKGTVKSAQDLDKVFARADHALALAHRARAAESWARKAYDQAGYELKAAAHSVEAAAAWTGDKAKAAAQAGAADARSVGDKLASAGVWTRDEVAKGFEGLGSALNRLGQDIGSPHKAGKVDVGA